MEDAALVAKTISLDPQEWATALRAAVRDWNRFPFVIVDLFAGAGGSANGVLRFCASIRVPVLLIMVNHWTRAIQTQVLNFPGAWHFNASVETLNPATIVPWLHVDLFTASPECIYFSPARGKNKKIREQSRSSASFILTWLDQLHVARFAIENVREYRSWGRLNKAGTGTLKGYEGEYYRALIRRLKHLGYKRVIDADLNAADYGSPTSRTRLFICGKKGDLPIAMPAPTHTRFPQRHLERAPWRTAREILDFDDKGGSTFARRDQKGRRLGPHAPASLRRAKAGLLIQVPTRPGAAAYVAAYERFLPIAQTYADAMPPTQRWLQQASPAKANLWRSRYDLPQNKRSLRLREQLAILARVGAEWRSRYGLPGQGPLTERERRFIRRQNIERAWEATRATFALPIMEFTSEQLGLPVPWTQGLRTHSSPHLIDRDPLHAATSAGGGGRVFAEPVIVGQHGGSVARPLDAGPLMTIAAGGAIALAEPRIIRATAGGKNGFDDAHRDVDRPIPVLTATQSFALAAPTIAVVNHGDKDARTASLDDPLTTITGKNALALATPALIQAAHADTERPRRPAELDHPLATIHAGGNGFALANPFISRQYSYGGQIDLSSQSLDDPLGTVTAGGQHHAIVQPFIVNRSSDHQHQGSPSNRTSSIDEPAPTVTGSGGGYLAEPFLYERHGERPTQRPRVHPVDKPMLTVTPDCNPTLVQSTYTQNDPDADYKPKITIDGHVFVIDVLYRMLRSRELARAMDLVDEQRGYDFQFAGTETEIVRQIGNAVPSNVMQALAGMLCDDVQGLPEGASVMRLLVDPFKPTDALGLYHEPIVRVNENSIDAPPAWFDPRRDPAQVGVVAPNGWAVYVQLETNTAARAAEHPYEVVVGESDYPTRLTLFEDAA